MTKTRVKKIKSKVLSSSIVILVFGLCAIFVLQFGEMIKENYVLAQCENNIEELSLENQKLSDDFLKINGLGNLREIAKNLNFEKPETIRYIKVITGEVATR